MKKLAFWALIVAATQTWATVVNFYGPCSPIPLGSKSVLTGGHLGNMTVSALKTLNWSFDGDTSFINSIKNMPSSSQGYEKLANGNERYYGWCASINGIEIESMMSDVYPRSSDRVDWYLGYMEKMGGQWSKCLPAFKVRPVLLCQNRAYVGEDEIEKSSPRLKAWASKVVDFNPGLRLKTEAPHMCLGPAEADIFSVTSLGEGGSITLGFDDVITNIEGADFAVFENAFAPDFLELAYVEVSSNGVDFVRFPAYSFIDHKVSAFGHVTKDDFYMMAGKSQVGIGQGFDLDWLLGLSEIENGKVDLSAIKFVRIVDVIGDGSQFGVFGEPIYDPYPTKDSAGFDLDAVGVLAF